MIPLKAQTVEGQDREGQQLFQRLLAAQNSDGGWSYQLEPSAGSRLDSSRTEPTALALIACHAHQQTTDAYSRGMAWLAAKQRPDGGWTPNDNVVISTSVSSLALIALLSSPRHRQAAHKAATWTAGQVYSSAFSPALLLARLLHLPPVHAPGSVAWYPGTAGWVIPTAMSILALSQASRLLDRPQLESAVKESQNYLLGRRCVDGGWNHGGSSTRSEDSTSYPETTGISLLALSSVTGEQLAAPLKAGLKLLRAPESIEGLSWLQMGLTANGVSVAGEVSVGHPRTSRDTALRLLALAACAGHTMLLSRNVGQQG